MGSLQLALLPIHHLWNKWQQGRRVQWRPQLQRHEVIHLKPFRGCEEWWRSGSLGCGWCLGVSRKPKERGVQLSGSTKTIMQMQCVRLLACTHNAAAVVQFGTWPRLFVTCIISLRS